ncbi:MAG: ribosome biogenesis GTPase Der [Chthoniobacterales bacterium]
MKTVVIAGRPNVGKSAIFNRLAGRRISIVHDQPGVTRDRLATVCKIKNTSLELVDTGGIGTEADVDFSEQVEEAALLAIENASLVLFVVDGIEGITPTDLELARRFRKSGRPILLVINKIDTNSHDDLDADFAKLAFTDSLAISAAHGRGFAELKNYISDHLGPDDEQASRRSCRIAIVGRPNVGKSSLINAILGDDRTIVSNLAGTTRDAVDISYQYANHEYILCDTAGIRHRSRHNTSVEVFSVMRSEESIRRADICVLVLDIAQGVTMQDKKIASLIQKANKPVIVVANKWDTVPSAERNASGLRHYTGELRRKLFFFDFAPIILTSAKTGGQVSKLLQEVENVRAAASQRISTGELNRLLQNLIEKTPPPSRNGKRFKLLYATQLRGADERHAFHPPVIVLFVNDPRVLVPAYEEFLKKKIRARQPYPGLPLLLKTKGRERRGEMRDKKDA